MIQNNFLSPDKDAEKRQALAKIYSLLIKLAEDVDAPRSETKQEEKEVPAPLKENIPPQGRV
ncbi:MAG: hypothetical protein H6634_13310 [Anaerolineales bacterium]|nr:hypothetical protein [Anaerolineales bacterium]